MKIDPVIIHDATNKWVKGKPEPADEMKKKHNPLVRFWIRDDLSRRRKTVANFLGQVSCLSKLFDILLLEAIQLPPAPDPDIFGEPLFAGEEERLGARARAKGNGRAEGKGVGKEEEALSLYRGNKNFCASLLA